MVHLRKELWEHGVSDITASLLINTERDVHENRLQVYSLLTYFMTLARWHVDEKEKMFF